MPHQTPYVAHAAAPPDGERFFYGWFIVGILFVVSIIDGGFTYIFSAFLKPLSEDFGWTRAQTAGGFSLYLVAAGLALPLWGWLADQRGARMVFLLCGLIDGLALLLLSTIDGLIGFYALYLALGVGLGGIGPATVGKVVSEWFVAKRGRAMGIALVGSSGGGLVLLPIAGFLIAAFSWRVAYQGLAMLALVVMVPLVWFFLASKPVERGLMPLGCEGGSDGEGVPGNPAQESCSIRDWTLREALSTSTFWLLGAAFGFGILAGMAVTTHQVAFLQDAGLTLEMASTLGGVTLGMSMGGRLAVGWVGERAQHLHRLLALCLVMQATGVGLLLGHQALGAWTFMVFVPLFGLGWGGLFVLWPLTVAHDFGMRSLGAISAVLGTVAVSFGGAIGPMLVGRMYDSAGDYFAAFLCCVGALLIAAAAAFVTREPGTTAAVLTPDEAIRALAQ